jgi:quercetin dioxygenase-like cupin family protein
MKIMQRRKFITATAASIPLLAIGQELSSQPIRTEKGFVIKANQSRYGEKTILNGLNPNNIKISSKDTDSNLTLFEYIGNEKGGPPLHIHPNQDEIFIIVNGEYLFQVGTEQHILKIGDTIFLPRNVPHTFAQTSATGKMIFLFQPSGKMEDFFRAIGSLSAPPKPETAAKIFEEHDMKIVGPPLNY